MQTQSESLVRKQFFISPKNVAKLEKLSANLKGVSAAKIVRDAIDAYDPEGNQTEVKEKELLALAHSKVKEALEATEQANRKIDLCLENLSVKDGE
ncbi:MAG: hypothetical protein MI863_01955 [Desulfobacterales bacterium]|nr:hypothetical protein [Desulfobacterales bacterium]